MICSLFSPEEVLIPVIIEELTGLFGPTDWVSPALFFDKSRYYESEMGWPLHRRFVSFTELIDPASLVDIKLKTNELESQYAEGGKRRVNIDPGYVALERVVLATGKNYAHRIYLGKGIYGDLTLIYKKGSYRPLEWTYKDYAGPEIIGYLNEIRRRYMDQLRRK